jgi:hypothetical protein
VQLRRTPFMAALGAQVMSSESLAGILSLCGVALGFGLSELSQWLKGRRKKREYRSALEAELSAIVRMAPSRIDLLSQAHGKFKDGQAVPTASTHFPRQAYEHLIEEMPELLSSNERDCLHIAYERLRIIDAEMDATIDRLNSISGVNGPLHAAHAVAGMLADLRNSLPSTIELCQSVLDVLMHSEMSSRRDRRT